MLGRFLGSTKPKGSCPCWRSRLSRASLPVLRKSALPTPSSANLDKGAAFAGGQEESTPPRCCSNNAASRPDMFLRSPRQVQIATDSGQRNGSARARRRREAPKFEDNETTLDQLKGPDREDDRFPPRRSIGPADRRARAEPRDQFFPSGRTRVKMRGRRLPQTTFVPARISISTSPRPTRFLPPFAASRSAKRDFFLGAIPPEDGSENSSEHGKIPSRWGPRRAAAQPAAHPGRVPLKSTSGAPHIVLCRPVPTPGFGQHKDSGAFRPLPDLAANASRG